MRAFNEKYIDNHSNIFNLISELQTIFHKSLGLFINYGYQSESYLRPLFSPKVLFIIKESYLCFLPSLIELNRQTGYFPKLLSLVEKLEKQGYVTYGKVASILACYYQECESVYRSFNTMMQVLEPVPQYHFKDFTRIKEDDDYLTHLDRIVLFLQDHLKCFLIDAYLFGSFGSDDYVKYWSDVDILIVVRKEVLQDHEKLIRLARVSRKARVLSYYVDPLQIHGFFVLAETDFQFYPSFFFPLVLFR